MKFCAVICEFNPFHKGHAYLLKEAKRQSGADGVLCIMSGNFTQRGDFAVFEKYTRARHAVLNGADVVLELPAAFSVSPAELFARGAVHILSSVPNVTSLVFGCESGTKEDFLRTANATLREDKAFRDALRENLRDGDSFIRARNFALLSLDKTLPRELLSTPNNVLGTEYCRALLCEKSAIEPIPVLRRGAAHGDEEPRRKLSSSTAIRSLLGTDTFHTRRLLRSNLPRTVYEDTPLYRPSPYGQAVLLSLLSSKAEDVAKCPDCSEGLENRLMSLARVNPDFLETLEKTVSRRYTRSRLKRILAQNFLGVTLKDVKRYLEAPLYCRTLAVKKARADEILSSLSGGFPLVTRKIDGGLLKKEALECMQLDLHAKELSDVLRGAHTGSYETLFL